MSQRVIGATRVLRAAAQPLNEAAASSAQPNPWLKQAPRTKKGRRKKTARKTAADFALAASWESLSSNPRARTGSRQGQPFDLALDTAATQCQQCQTDLRVHSWSRGNGSWRRRRSTVEPSHCIWIDDGLGWLAGRTLHMSLGAGAGADTNVSVAGNQSN